MKPLKLTADLRLTGTLTEWSATEGERPKLLILQGDSCEVKVLAPPKGRGVPTTWKMTLEGE